MTYEEVIADMREAAAERYEGPGPARVAEWLAVIESAAPEEQRTVWLVASKTTSLLFAKKEDAEAYRAGFGAATGGGMTITECPVVSWREPQSSGS